MDLELAEPRCSVWVRIPRLRGVFGSLQKQILQKIEEEETGSVVGVFCKSVKVLEPQQ